MKSRPTSVLSRTVCGVIAAGLMTFTIGCEPPRPPAPEKEDVIEEPVEVSSNTSGNTTGNTTGNVTGASETPIGETPVGETP